MAFSSSSSSPGNSWKHDVFLNFRGQDTRNNFTAHLHEALQKQGIDAFIDHKLEMGEEISPALLQVIEGSRISIVIFSENYASSTYCLDELVKIIECKQCKGQKILPIFYKVDPTMVAEQTGSFGEALARHEAEFMKNMETLPWWSGALTKVASFSGLHLNKSTQHKDRVLINIDRVKRWKAALTEAANLVGWDLKNRNEADCIRTIVKKVINLLKSIHLHVAEHPVGLESPIKELSSLLNIESNEVRIVGIYGLGGIGKTTIAKAIYNSIASKFDGSCFLANVRETSNKHGIAQQQRTLLSEILGDEVACIHNCDTGINVIKKKLCTKRVLIIIDDVDNVDQLQKLAGDKEWFGAKSRIIITTRDEHILVAHGIERKYKVKELCFEDAIMLLSWHAFKMSQPLEEFVDISYHMARYAQGLPLALITWGSFLCGRSVVEWQSELNRLKRSPKKGVYEIIKRSYDDLEDNEKAIFLDIACFFKGMNEHKVMQILYACDFDPLIGVKVLIERSLIQISGVGKMLQMHDVIQSIGMQIAIQEFPVPGGRRLWFNKDALNVVTTNEGTNDIEGLKINVPESEEKLYIKANFLFKMKRLRILIIHNVHIFGCLQNLPNLIFFELSSCSLESISSDFYPSKLVVFNMPHSIIRRFVHKIKNYINLQYVDFSECKFLKETPDFSSTPNIVDLRFIGCNNLVNIHPSIGFLDKLVYLSFLGCINLRNLTAHLRLRSLLSLDLSDCFKFEKFPNIEEGMTSLKSIYLSNTAIKELPSSVQNLVGLHWLYMSDCRKLASVINILKLPELRGLILGGSKKLDKLLEEVGIALGQPDSSSSTVISNWLSKLVYLDVSGSNFSSLPLWICKCTNLRALNLCGCPNLQEILELPQSVKFLYAWNCKSLERYPESASLFNNGMIIYLSDQVKALRGSFEKINKDFSIEHIFTGKMLPEWLNYFSEDAYLSFNVPSQTFGKFMILIFCFIVMLKESEQISISIAINGVKFHSFKLKPQFTMESDHTWCYCLQCGGAMKEFQALLSNESNRCLEVFITYNECTKAALKRWGVFLTYRPDDCIDAISGSSYRGNESPDMMGSSHDDIVDCTGKGKRITNAPDEEENSMMKKKWKLVINN